MEKRPHIILVYTINTNIGRDDDITVLKSDPIYETDEMIKTIKRVERHNQINRSNVRIEKHNFNSWSDLDIEI